MYSVGVIGDYDSICGFSALGLDIFPVSSLEEAGKKLKTMLGGQYGIIYITEPLMEQLESNCAQYNGLSIPAIIPIPSCTGVTGYGQGRLKNFVEKAVGSDVIFNDGE